MLVAQGADLKAFNKKLALDSTAPVVVELKAEKSGYISKCDARLIGEVIRDLGGGRLTKESVINYDVGIDQIAKPGERVEKSATLCRVHAADSNQAKAAIARLKAAFEISAKPPWQNFAGRGSHSVEQASRLSPMLLSSEVMRQAGRLSYFNDSKIFSAAARGFSAA